MSLFSRVVNFLPGHREEHSEPLSTVTNEKSGSDDTDETRQGTDPDLEQQEEGGIMAVQADNLDRRRAVRTLPPWIHSVRRGEEDDIIDPSARLLPTLPSARYPHHNHMPIPKPRVQIDGKGKGPRHDRPDSLEDDTLRRSRWNTYARASAFPRLHSEIVTEEWKAQNLHDLDAPWAPHLTADDEDLDGMPWILSHRKRKAKAIAAHRVLMRNPFIPLIIRLTVLSFSAAALGLGAWIYHDSLILNYTTSLTAGTTTSPGVTDTETYICDQQASTYMAFIVPSFAVLYLMYITWDEYFSKPLGLRSTHAKLRLLFLDLLFIVFSAANLSLAFNTLTDQQWACYESPGSSTNNNNQKAATSTCVYDQALCQRQRALCGILLTATFAWVSTFAISVFRVVEKISG